MNVLSLFDGMSCGQIALERAGIKVDKYFASEIDKYAVQVTKANYPETVHLGDVTGVRASDLPNIDLLIGGSPCQGFSFAGRQLNFEDPRSALFFEFVRLKRELNPRYFLLENVKMKKEFQDIISQQLGVEPIQINSALVSAQNRVRLYWTNIPGVQQPADRGIVLSDILEDHKQPYSSKGGRIVGRRINDQGTREDYNTEIPTKQYLEARKDSKANCMTTVQKDSVLIRKKSKCVRSGGRGSVDRHEWDSTDSSHSRKFSVKECERLQTVPDNYTAAVSNTQRYKMLGNGWTVDVISHIFKNLK